MVCVTSGNQPFGSCLQLLDHISPRKCLEQIVQSVGGEREREEELVGEREMAESRDSERVGIVREWE